jgi:hypothetical protein
MIHSITVDQFEETPHSLHLHSIPVPSEKGTIFNTSVSQFCIQFQVEGRGGGHQSAPSAGMRAPLKRSSSEKPGRKLTQSRSGGESA